MGLMMESPRSTLPNNLGSSSQRSLAKFLLVLDQCIQDDIKVGGAIIKQQLGDFGKPWGVCARAAIGRVLCFLRCKDDNANYA
ncbi:hypothetical protein FXO38_16501 [Capsicum annuum]|nr:hypothetical protein FXO38_16501 [Capsicum annuum]KAF3659403.1 hypothetical protein FXO37_13997 [Capsicum annuum]